MDIENTNPTPAAPTYIDLKGGVSNGPIAPAIINNPIGQTIIKNMGGSIESTGPTAIVVTNTLDIEALDNIGTLADRIFTQLVQSTDQLTGVLRTTFLTAISTDGNVDMDVTGRERSNTATTPFTIYMDNVSAGGDVNLLLESSLLDVGASGNIGNITVEVYDLAASSLHQRRI